MMNSRRETIWSPLGGKFEREILEQPKAPDDVDYGIELTIK